MKKTALALALVLLSTTAMADNRRGFYVGGGATRLDTGVQTGSGGTLDFSTLELIGGYHYNWWAGGEVRVGTGLTKDQYTNGTTTWDYSVSNHASIYYRPEISNQVAKLYGLLGWGNVKLKTDTASGSDSGMSYGAGVGFITSERTNLNFEYRVMLDTSDRKYEAFGINLDFRF